MEKLKYTPPTTSCRRLEFSGVIALSYVPEKEIKGKMTIQTDAMRLQEGTENGEIFSNYNDFTYSWEEE